MKLHQLINYFDKTKIRWSVLPFPFLGKSQSLPVAVVLSVSVSVCVCVCLFVTIVHTGHTLAEIKNVRIRIIVKIVLDLHFEGKKFETFISEMVRASAKMHGTIFADFYISH